MKFNDPEYKLLQYLAKPLRLNQIMLAHKKCLKPVGNDYALLEDIEAGRNKDYPTELIPWTDAEFDMEKIKALFVERGVAKDEADFDTALTSLRTAGIVDPTFAKVKSSKLANADTLLAQVIAAKEVVEPAIRK